MRALRHAPGMGLARAGRVAGRLLDLALPASCAGCRREGEPLCAACAAALHARRGRPPGVALGLPSDVPLPLVQLEWCAPFDGAVRAALHALKYAGERRLARPLGVAAAARWREAGAGGDVLVHVPVHARRRASRGYDQAELLARAIGAELPLPAEAALRRERDTAPQFELGRGDRARNVEASFSVAEERRAAIVGRWVVLVDDVATTGSTLAACAGALLGGGAAAVSALTVARET